MQFSASGNAQIDSLNQLEMLSVYLETPDGLGFQGKAMVGQLDRNAEFYRDRLAREEWELTLSGIDRFTLTKGVDMAKMIAARFLPQEWVCKFCERANSVDQYQCQSCGWYRGIIADVVQEMGIWRPR